MAILVRTTSDIVGSTSTLTPPTVGTIVAWIRPSALSGTQRILGCSDNFEGRFDGTTLYSDWGISGGNSLNFGALSNNVLYHIAATWNVSTGAGQTYLDGAFVASDSARNGVSGGAFSLNARGTTNPFINALDDARIYNRVLSAGEIESIYRSRGSDSIHSGLLHRWTMSEGEAGANIVANGVKDVVGGYHLGIRSGTPQYARGTILFRRRRA